MIRRLTPAPSLADRVAELVKESLASGDYAVGDCLRSEVEMAKSFGVSRTVMREAVARLKSEGLLESRQGSGLFVLATAPRVSFQIEAETGVNLERAMQVLEFRGGFEVSSAGLAATRASANDLAAMRAAIETMEAAIEAQEVRRGAEADLEFHAAICAATGNPLFPQLFETFRAFLLETLDITRGNSLNRLHDARPSQVEHMEIFEAIRARDVAQARGAAGRHILNTRLRLEKAVRHQEAIANGEPTPSLTP